jgi:hypothetical protein
MPGRAGICIAARIYEAGRKSDADAARKVFNGWPAPGGNFSLLFPCGNRGKRRVDAARHYRNAAEHLDYGSVRHGHTL